jgi:hypothetical protein
MPSGIPVGGIFTQIAARSSHASAGVLTVDAVAIDFSTLNAAQVAPAVVAGGQSASLITQAAGSTPSPGGVLNTPLRLTSNSIPRPKPPQIAKRPAVERAQLPEVIALAAIGNPKTRPVSDVVQAAIPSPSIDSMTEQTTQPEGLAIAEALPFSIRRSEPGDAGTSETDQNEQRAPANAVIYSAGWVTVAVSAPGLASTIRRGRRRVRRRSIVVAKGPLPGLAR